MEYYSYLSITEDPTHGTLYASIEAGAVIRSEDGRLEWIDTEKGHPLDAHTLLTHTKAPNVSMQLVVME